MTKWTTSFLPIVSCSLEVNVTRWSDGKRREPGEQAGDVGLGVRVALDRDRRRRRGDAAGRVSRNRRGRPVGEVRRPPAGSPRGS